MQENKNAYNLILPALNDKLSFEANCMMIFRLNHSEWSVRLEKCYVNAASFHFIKTVGLVFLMDSNLTNMLNIWWRVQRKLSFLTVGANQRGDSFFFSITTFSFILFSFVFLCRNVIYDCPFWAPGVFILPFKHMNEQTDGRRGGESAIFPGCTT